MSTGKKANILAFNATGVIDELADSSDARLNANENCMLLVLSSAPLPEDARTAIENSADKLGFGSDSCGWLEGAAKLSPQQIWRTIEGLDPEAVVITDSETASAVSAAYNQSITLDKLNRIACRNVSAFANFPDMLNDNRTKQIAWSVLKRLK